MIIAVVDGIELQHSMAGIQPFVSLHFSIWNNDSFQWQVTVKLRAKDRAVIRCHHALQVGRGRTREPANAPRTILSDTIENSRRRPQRHGSLQPLIFHKAVACGFSSGGKSGGCERSGAIKDGAAIRPKTFEFKQRIALTKFEAFKRNPASRPLSW